MKLEKSKKYKTSFLFKILNLNSMGEAHCLICENHESVLVDIHELTFIHQDGSLLNPVEDLIRIASEEGLSLVIPKYEKCCEACASDLQNLSVQERTLANLKEELLCKVKAGKRSISGPTEERSGFPMKRKRNKPKRYTNEDSEEGEADDEKEFSSNKCHTIVEVPFEDENVIDNFELRTRMFKEYVQKTLKVSYPRCTLSKVVESRVKCLSKQCSLSITFEVVNERKTFVVKTKGLCSDHDQDDPNRVLFEMTRAEYNEECICEFCCERFESEDSLSQHQKEVNESSFKCPLCSIESKTFHSRNSHFLLNHSTDKPYGCIKEGCKLTFKTKYKKTEHERICLNDVRIQCPSCPKTFISQRNLNDHCKIVHEKDETKFQHKCIHCDKKFYKKCNLDSHLLSHDTGTEKKFECGQPDCGQTFKRLRALKSHQELKHSGMKKAYLCSTCGHCLESYTGYRQHLAKHNGTIYIERKYSCSDCQKSFRSPSDLRIHQVVHTKSKAFNCDLCNATFTQKSSLKDHYNVHLKKYTCNICQKSFGRQRYLESHVKGCGHSRNKDQGQEEDNNEQEASTVILINNDGQQTLQQVSFMVATTATTSDHQSGQEAMVS